MQRHELQGDIKQHRFWLVNILIRRERPFLGRLLNAYHRLLRLPRRMRRLLQRRLTVRLSGIALLLALSHAPARAETIHVQDGEVVIAANARCSLVEAIRNANDTATGQPHADCSPGDPGGGDTVSLPSNGTFTLSERFTNYQYSYENGLPFIDSVVTIEGHGSSIKGDPPDFDGFRLLAVSAGGALTLNEVTITGFSALRGGAIYSAGTVAINDTTLSGNTAQFGGAIYMSGSGSDSELTIRRSTLNGNHAESGGAIRAITAEGDQWGTLRIYDTTLSGNSVFGFTSVGGALDTFRLHVIIDNSAFIGNRAGDVDLGGFHGIGGAFHNGGNAEITNSIFSGNVAADRAGAIDNAGSLLLVNSTFSGNMAEQNGGGIVNHDSVTITNSTLTGNSAQRGGGIFNAASLCDGCFGTATLVHSLVSGNVDGDAGQELYNETVSYGGTTNMGVVVADNFNLFGYSGDPGLVNVDVQPLDIVPDEPLAAILDLDLADNGGPTHTHALVDNSPALDVAPNGACIAAPVNGRDQRGSPRNVNRAGEVSDNDCDIGAFELQIMHPVFAPVVAR
jgi:predicted outer membrane repeat protein